MATFLSTLVTPAGTPESAPARQELRLIAGQITLIRLYVPPGPRGELSLRVMHRGVQILPQRPGTWIKPDNAIIPYPLAYDITEGDDFIELQGVSTNANFQHTVDFEATMIPASGVSDSPSLADRIFSLFS